MKTAILRSAGRNGTEEGDVFDPTPNQWNDIDDISERLSFAQPCPKCGTVTEPSEVKSEESDPREAYEHWIVSRWLAKKLEERGEMVVYDFLGMTIWGRCTTGQAISLDWIIRDIYLSLQK